MLEVGRFITDPESGGPPICHIYSLFPLEIQVDSSA